MSDLPPSTHARLTLTIEVEAGSAWSNDVTMQQVFDQAERETVNAIEQLFLEGRQGSMRLRARIIGRPLVTAILASGNASRK